MTDDFGRLKGGPGGPPLPRAGGSGWTILMTSPDVVAMRAAKIPVLARADAEEATTLAQETRALMEAADMNALDRAGDPSFTRSPAAELRRAVARADASANEARMYAELARSNVDRLADHGWMDANEAMRIFDLAAKAREVAGEAVSTARAALDAARVIVDGSSG